MQSQQKSSSWRKKRSEVLAWCPGARGQRSAHNRRRHRRPSDSDLFFCLSSPDSLCCVPAVSLTRPNDSSVHPSSSPWVNHVRLLLTGPVSFNDFILLSSISIYGGHDKEVQLCVSIRIVQCSLSDNLNPNAVTQPELERLKKRFMKLDRSVAVNYIACC